MSIRWTHGRSVRHSGAVCGDIYTSGDTVTLTATPNANSTFSGWTGIGGCPGTAPCQVLMDQAQTVTATFAQIPRLLTVTRAGRSTRSAIV